MSGVVERRGVVFTKMQKEEDDAEKLFQRGCDLRFGRNGMKKNLIEMVLAEPVW